MKPGFLLAASLALLAAPALQAQSKPADPPAQVALPQTDRGRMAKEWLEAYNGGDENVYRKFMQVNAEQGGTPVERRVDRFREMKENLGHLTVLEAKETTEGIELKVRTGKGEEGLVTVMISSGHPLRFQAVKVEI